MEEQRLYEMVNLRRQFKVDCRLSDTHTHTHIFLNVFLNLSILSVLQDLLRSHGLLESEDSTPSGGDRGQRRERLTERRKLHQMKRDHEQQEGSKRKVLRLEEGQDGEFSSGSDTEETGRRKKDKEKSEQNVDIQVGTV